MLGVFPLGISIPYSVWSLQCVYIIKPVHSEHRSCPETSMNFYQMNEGHMQNLSLRLTEYYVVRDYRGMGV
jgi:hypothetical protein